MINGKASPAQQSDEVQAKVQHFIQLAVQGLVPMFDQQRQIFCHRLKKTEHGLVQEGLSPRYTMMTLMGLHRFEEAGGTSPIDARPVLEALLTNLDWVDNIGDLGLVLWLCALIAPDRLADLRNRLQPETALVRYRGAKHGITMELAWFLTGISYWGLACPEKLPELQDLAFKTYTLLKQNQGEGAFFGHLSTDKSFIGRLRGRVGSFADQVYPIYAMTQFYKAYQNEEAAKRAMDCGLALCKAQGPLGQWWWHYDSAHGKVAEGYPVFSVHQHAMGPMTLFALGETMQYDFTPFIYKGLEWISNNELGFDMENSSASLVWRSIYRSRFAFAKYWNAGFGRHSESIQHDRRDGLRVRYECRPYELGWLLYAFATRAKKATTIDAEVALRSSGSFAGS